MPLPPGPPERIGDDRRRGFDAETPAERRPDRRRRSVGIERQAGRPCPGRHWRRRRRRWRRRSRGPSPRSSRRGPSGRSATDSRSTTSTWRASLPNRVGPVGVPVATARSRGDRTSRPSALLTILCVTTRTSPVFQVRCRTARSHRPIRPARSSPGFTSGIPARPKMRSSGVARDGVAHQAMSRKANSMSACALVESARLIAREHARRSSGVSRSNAVPAMNEVATSRPSRCASSTCWRSCPSPKWKLNALPRRELCRAEASARWCRFRGDPGAITTGASRRSRWRTSSPVKSGRSPKRIKRARPPLSNRDTRPQRRWPGCSPGTSGGCANRHDALDRAGGQIQHVRIRADHDDAVDDSERTRPRRRRVNIRRVKRGAAVRREDTGEAGLAADTTSGAGRSRRCRRSRRPLPARASDRPKASTSSANRRRSAASPMIGLRDQDAHVEGDPIGERPASCSSITNPSIRSS